MFNENKIFNIESNIIFSLRYQTN